MKLDSGKRLTICFLSLSLGLGGMFAASATTISKPAPGAQIDWNQPLARGLVTALSLSEGSGTNFYDTVTQQTYSAKVLSGSSSGAQPPTWIHPAVSTDYPWIGPAISNNGATAQAIQSTNLATQILDPTKVGVGYSYAVLVEPLNPTTLGRIFDTTANAPMVMYMLNNRGQFGPRSFSATWVNGSGVAVNPVYQYTLNKWILVLCTVQNGKGVMYVNGVQVASDSTINLANSVAGVTGQLVYNATGNGSLMFDANFSSFWGWSNRVLTAQEAASFYANPWSMYAQDTDLPTMPVAGLAVLGVVLLVTAVRFLPRPS